VGTPLLVARERLFDEVSIQLVSPASGDQNASRAGGVARRCFHSISFPSEWGPGCTGTPRTGCLVSIQLVSPASGDLYQEDSIVL